MDINLDNVAYVETVLDDSQDNSELIRQSKAEQNGHNVRSNTNGKFEKHSAVWTTNATLTLLKLYEAKLEMLETPKKKTRIWLAISSSLKEYNIEMTPNQVRWKINALAKKYKQCIDSGQHMKFKYFKQMDNIYLKYNVDCDSYITHNASILQKKNNICKDDMAVNESFSCLKSNPESKAMIELRKLRLVNRIESDRSQNKINLEKQWLEYLKQQEQQKKLKDDIHEKSLKLKEEILDLKKKELEMKETFELRKLELREKEQETMLEVERQKCEMLKKIFSQHFNSYKIQE